ncbi:helix-turn-helix domain-containing protein [Rhodospirillum centenum]|nr:helix-turn-helix transcriptional regulator [Rhodospirillum centenum]
MAKRRPKGWHKEDIKAAIRKRGTTVTDLALSNGLGSSTCRVALNTPCFTGEQVIAEFLGVPAQVLWPDRYEPDGTPRHPRVRNRLKGIRNQNECERQEARAA